MSNVFQSKEQKDLFLTLLKVMGGRKAQVEFNGSGDSGSIEWVGLLDQEGNTIDLTNATFDWHERSGQFEAGKWYVRYTPKPNMPVSDILQAICEDALDDAGHDWYNNDGGYGSLTIDLTTTPPEIKLNVSIRYTSTEDYEHDLTDGEDDEDEIKEGEDEGTV